jgi:hypothetical protein
MSPRLAIPAVTAVTFIVAFGVAELTDVRALGGLVLVAGGGWAARLALRVTGPGVTAALVVAALGLFVLSHLLGDAIGAWPAVALCALFVAATAGAVLSRAGVAGAMRGRR